MHGCDCVGDVEWHQCHCLMLLRLCCISGIACRILVSVSQSFIENQWASLRNRRVLVWLCVVIGVHKGKLDSTPL